MACNLFFSLDCVVDIPSGGRSCDDEAGRGLCICICTYLLRLPRSGGASAINHMLKRSPSTSNSTAFSAKLKIYSPAKGRKNTCERTRDCEKWVSLSLVLRWPKWSHAHVHFIHIVVYALCFAFALSHFRTGKLCDSSLELRSSYVMSVREIYILSSFSSSRLFISRHSSEDISTNESLSCSLGPKVGANEGNCRGKWVRKGRCR